MKNSTSEEIINKDLAEKVYLTGEGLAKLKEELDHLKNVKRKEVTERIAKAREYGDISENSEYDTARDEQSFTEGRILEIESILKRSEVIEETHLGMVQIGSSVTVEIDGDRDTYHIVGTMEAEPESGRISHESPVGKALIGLKVGDEVDVTTPYATLHYRIKAIN
ncbi:MAG: transcription elongation factor GreA [bacterium]|nr:transcription elongation factor GreA [bacterium]